MTDVQQRLSRIEDRRIEILLEIGKINREYDERVSSLREEYEELASEYYLLRLSRISGGQSSMPFRGDGEL